MSRKKTPQAAIEKVLWSAANKLRKNIDAAEYKHVVLGLIFLRYMADAFEDLYGKIESGQGEFAYAKPEEREEYTARNIFFIPKQARWSYLRNHAKQPNIGQLINEAMDTIEQENHTLKGVLPKVYTRKNLDPTSLGQLIDEISNIAFNDAKKRSADVLGHVFEYFLGEFALAEGKKGGQFYTPKCIVELLVTMLEPYQGRVMDPCCGSGGMFVQSEKFVKEHQGNTNKLSLFGQESNHTTWRLAKMNLAIRKIDSSQIQYNQEGSFIKDAHPNIKVDYIIANPPFNQSAWQDGVSLDKDARWRYGIPPKSNANYAWIQHFLYHLNPTGQAGFVLSNGALTSKSSGEGTMRKNLVDAKLVDCIVSLPTKLFLNTGIPACLWFMSKDRSNHTFRNRVDEILFIDATNLGRMLNRRVRILSSEEIQHIADTYHAWRNPKGSYRDQPGFCAAMPITEVQKQAYILTPGRYVGMAPDEATIDFAERFTELKSTFEAQIAEEKALNERIVANLNKLQYDEPC